MKQVLSACVAGLIAASGIPAASARAAGTADDVPVVSREGITTEITFTDGTVRTLAGAVDASRLESWGGISTVASYSVRGEDTELFSVTLNGITAEDDSVGALTAQKMNGYYAIDFTFPDDGREAFLTGLTPTNLEETQSALIDSFVYGEELQLENFSYIDVEKTTYSHNDDLLCWAAGASNTLQYTGWLTPAGFGDSDDMLDRFTEDFDDGVLSAFDGYRWFFNGVCVTDRYSAQVKNPNGGAYMPDYPYELLTEERSVRADSIERLQEMYRRLREGCGVSLQVSFPSGAAHVITCWGYIVDNAFDADDPQHYTALIISDSDSDMQPQQDRRVAPNKLNILSMVQEDSVWWFPTYQNATLFKYTYIVPYDQAPLVETDPDATRDRVNNVDFSLIDLSFGGGTFPNLNSAGIIYAGVSPVLSFSIKSFSKKTFCGLLEYQVTVKNAAGETVLSEVHTVDIYLKSMNTTLVSYEMLDSGLPAGSYTAEITLNCGKKIDEAFYFNNKATASFEVVEIDTDLSGLGVTASVSEIHPNGTVTSTVGYTGFDDAPDVTLLSTSYMTGTVGYHKTTWSGDWVNLSPKGSAHAVGAPALLQKDIAAADVYMFRTMNSVKNYDGGRFYVYSGAVSPPFCGAEIVPAQENGKIDLPAGEKSLGKTLAFTARNTSADAYGDLTGEMFFAVNTAAKIGGHVLVRLGDAAAIDLAPGETSAAISLDTLPADFAGEGVHAILAVVEGEAGGRRIHQEMQVATVRFREKPSTVVTTAADTDDPYDGETSLREAIAAYDGTGAVTFSAALTGSYSSTLSLSDALLIDKKVVIDAASDGACQVINSGVESSPVFTVKRTGELTLRGVKITGGLTQGFNEDLAPSNGGCILCEGGSVTLERCAFSSFIAKTYGGVIYCNGGVLKISDCHFSGNTAAFGGALALNNNAAGDIVNAEFVGNSSDKGAVFNNNSVLRMVSCSLYRNAKTELYGTEGAGAVTSFGETSLLNCALTDNLPGDDRVAYTPYDLAGAMSLYGCLYTAADKRVQADARCVSGVSRDDVLFYTLNTPTATQPDYVFEPVSVSMGNNDVFDGYYLPNPAALSKGMRVSVKDGALVYSDGTETYETSIPAAFDEALYAADARGNSRGAVFGCISDFTQPEEAMGCVQGDVNADGKVDISDATLLQRFLAEEVSLTPAQLAAAELHHEKNHLGASLSDYINISNVTEIQKFAAEIITDFSA